MVGRLGLSAMAHAVIATGLLAATLRTVGAMSPGVAFVVGDEIGASEDTMLGSLAFIHAATFASIALTALLAVGTPSHWVPVGIALAAAAAMELTTVHTRVWTFVLAYLLAGLLAVFHHALGDSTGRLFPGQEGLFEARRSMLASTVAGLVMLAGGLLLTRAAWTTVHHVLLAPLLAALAIAFVRWETPPVTARRPPRSGLPRAWKDVKSLPARLAAIPRGNGFPRYLRQLLINLLAQFSMAVAATAVALFFKRTETPSWTLLIACGVMLTSGVGLPSAGRAADAGRARQASTIAAMLLSASGAAIALVDLAHARLAVDAVTLVIAGYFGTAATTCVLTALVRTTMNKMQVTVRGQVSVAALGWLATSLGSMAAVAMPSFDGALGLLIVAAGGLTVLVVRRSGS